MENMGVCKFGGEDGCRDQGKYDKMVTAYFFEFWYDCQIREIPYKDPPRSGVGLEEGASFVSLSLLYPIGFSIRYTVRVVVVD